MPRRKRQHHRNTYYVIRTITTMKANLFSSGFSAREKKKEEKEKRGEKRVLRRRDLPEPIKPFCLGFSRFWKQPTRRKNSISVTGIYRGTKIQRSTATC